MYAGMLVQPSELLLPSVPSSPASAAAMSTLAQCFPEQHSAVPLACEELLGVLGVTREASPALALRLLRRVQLQAEEAAPKAIKCESK